MPKPLVKPVWVTALLDTSLTATQFRVWTYLLWRQGKNISAWPGIIRIASDLGLSESTVRRGLDGLVSAGWITRKRPTKNGRGHTNHYSIKGAIKTPITDRKGATDDRFSREKGQ